MSMEELHRFMAASNASLDQRVGVEGGEAAQMVRLQP